MIAKRVTVRVAVTVAVLFGLCLSAGMATAASDRTAVDATPIGGSDFDQPRDSGAADNSTLRAESTDITTANTGDVPAKVVDAKYGDDRDSAITEIVPTNDGNYLLVGAKRESSDDDNVTAAKVTPHGSIIWERTYGNEFNQTLWSGIQTQSGNFVLAGFTKGPDSQTGLGLKINPEGEIIWQINRDGFSEGIFRDVEETTNGRYLFVGQYNSSDGDDDAEVVKVSSDGSVLWNLIYWDQSKENEQGFDAIERVESDRYALAGDAYIDDEQWDAWSFEIDSNGEILSSETYGHPTFNDFFNDVGVTDAGVPVYAGIRNGNFEESSGEYTSHVAWVYYDDSSGATWSKEVAVDNLNTFESVSTDGDRIVAAGTSSASDGGKTDGLTVEYDTEGSQNWQLSTTPEDYHQIWDVLATRDKTYTAGFKQSNGDSVNSSLVKYTSATSQNTDSKVQLTNIELSQDSISNNSESDRTLTFDALNVSSDSEPDNLTVEMPQSVEIVDVTDVAVVNGDYDVTHSNNESVIEFTVDPERSVDSVDLVFEVDMTLIGSDTAANG